MRSLMVADAMKFANGFEPIFAINRNSDPDPVRAAGYPIIELAPEQQAICYLATLTQPTDGPLFLDSYVIETADLEYLADKGFCVSMFEDGRRLDFYPCDLVIDPAPNASSLDYQGGEKTNFCLGTDYFPLRSEFRQARSGTPRNGTVNTITVTFGGSDTDDQTMRVIEIIQRMGIDCRICAILGPGYEGKAKNSKDVVIVRKPENIAELLNKSDLVVSAAGGTALELAYLGLPMALIALADNQLQNATAIDQARAGLYLGQAIKISDDNISNAIKKLVENDECRKTYSKNGLKLVDGFSHKRISRQINKAWTFHQASQRKTK